MRKTIDLLIGTFCIEAGHALLHDDLDFEPMVVKRASRPASGRIKDSPLIRGASQRTIYE